MQITSIIIQIVVLLVAVVVGFLVAEYRRFKQVVDSKIGIVPEWTWLAESLARIGVRAAYQMFDNVDQRLPYVTDWIKDELSKRGFELDATAEKTIRMVIEAAWAEFKAELIKSGAFEHTTSKQPVLADGQQ